MALPTVPITLAVGDAVIAGEVVTVGTVFGWMMKVTLKVPVKPPLLVAPSETVNTPLVVGVPVMAPVLLFRLRPPGSVPELTV